MSRLILTEDCGGKRTIYLAGDQSEEIEAFAHNAAAEWIGDGDYGNAGGSVRVCWTLEDEGEEVDHGFLDVDLAVDHAKLIRAAGGDVDCEHDWTRAGEGGCDSNPGVFRAEGDGLVTREHCTARGGTPARVRRGLTSSQRAGAPSASARIVSAR